MSSAGTPTRLVVFGAGASFDSINPRDLKRALIASEQDQRPPLAAQLFENRETYGQIAHAGSCP